MRDPHTALTEARNTPVDLDCLIPNSVAVEVSRSTICFWWAHWAKARPDCFCLRARFCRLFTKVRYESKIAMCLLTAIHAEWPMGYQICSVDPRRFCRRSDRAWKDKSSLQLRVDATRSSLLDIISPLTVREACSLSSMWHDPVTID